MSSHSTSVHQAIKQSLIYQGQCVAPGRLYNLGRYPGLKQGDGHVSAELYAIEDEKVLDILDDYEARDNNNPNLPGFSRKLIKLINPQLSAWAYYYDGLVSEDKFINQVRGKRPFELR